DPYESRLTMGLFFVLGLVLILAARRVTWAAVRTLRSRGYNQTFAIVVGTGRVARKTARALRQASWMGIKNVAFVDAKNDHLCSDLDVLGGFADLPALINKYRGAHVFIALPMNRYDDG